MEEEGRGEGSWCAIGRRAAMGGGHTRPPMIAAPMAPRGPRGRLQWCRNVSGAATIAPVLSVLLVTFPFFALVLCGYLATRGGALPASAIGGLNSFVLYFALPAMLYRFGAQTPIAQLLDPAVAGVYLLCALLMVAGTIALTQRAVGWNDAAFGALVAAFPNTGFMGVPLLVALLGAHGAAVALRNALRGMATNPMPWSIVLGGVASALQWRLPVPVDQTLAMLAGAASPVALFTIGAVLARSQMNQHEQVPPGRYVPIALAKLVVHPLLML